MERFAQAKEAARKVVEERKLTEKKSEVSEKSSSSETAAAVACKVDREVLVNGDSRKSAGSSEVWRDT